MPVLVLAQLGSFSESLTSFFHLFNVEAADVRVAIAKSGATILAIWLMAWLANRLVNVLARRIIAAADDGDDTRLSYHEKRAQTIAQLLRSVGRVVIGVFAVILTLGQFMEIGPLLAGVSFFGLAFSFGSQSLVKDVISGFFILVENQFVVGDQIEVAGKSGLVERMTLRVVMLRDIEGTVHIIPNGQMTTVSNKTRGWSRAVVDVAVDYDSDIDHAIDALREEAHGLAADPHWAARLDGAPEVMGVQALGENAVTLRVLLRTHPGVQGEVGREFRRRVKIRFDREGIDIRASAARVPGERRSARESSPAASPTTDGLPGTS